jgi:hypothetical protein
VLKKLATTCTRPPGARTVAHSYLLLKKDPACAPPPSLFRHQQKQSPSKSNTVFTDAVAFAGTNPCANCASETSVCMRANAGGLPRVFAADAKACASTAPITRDRCTGIDDVIAVPRPS